MLRPIQQRNRDFAERCLQIMQRRRSLGMPFDRQAIVREALASRPALHYVSYDTASRALTRLSRGCFRHSHACEQWAELQQQVARTMAERRCSRSKALSYVLCFGRPSRYHITYRHANRLFGRALRKS